jgi:hypothetical protein
MKELAGEWNVSEAAGSFWQTGDRIPEDQYWPTIHTTYDLQFKQGKPGVLVLYTTGESLPGAARFSDTKVKKPSKPATKAPKKAAKKKASRVSRAIGKDDKNIEATSKLIDCKKCRPPVAILECSIARSIL